MSPLRRIAPESTDAPINSGQTGPEHPATHLKLGVPSLEKQLVDRRGPIPNSGMPRTSTAMPWPRTLSKTSSIL